MKLAKWSTAVHKCVLGIALYFACASQVLAQVPWVEAGPGIVTVWLTDDQLNSLNASGSIRLAPDSVGNAGFCVAPTTYLGYGSKQKAAGGAPALHIVNCGFAAKLAPVAPPPVKPPPVKPPPAVSAVNFSGRWTDGTSCITTTHTGNTIINVFQPGGYREQGTVNGNKIVIGKDEHNGGPIFDNNGNLTHIGWTGGTRQAWRRVLDSQNCP